MRYHRSVLKSMSSRVAPKDKTLPKDKQLKKWKIIRGDRVMAITGKDRGKIGEVTDVSRKTNRVFVKGLNLAKKSTPKSNDSDGILQIEMPIHVSNLALVDPSTNLPTKVRIATFIDPETGKKEKRRYSIGTGTHIVKNIDLSYQSEWKDGVLDCDPDVVSKMSFETVPGIPPFPEDVIREIKNRHRKLF
ncbi:hypothetical protein GGI25_005793 [Coemansia spiralis]|uniref:KOW domain-containing protein n=2 Tax=Coemansia TaxID=4863 RepID=A0A9W8G1K6_9FUNG|nr:translation protein SH3-like domain-containing protein [Coemansia spiralis]KAJ1987286.1 hypothetical protein EDC05_005906 [Coemansia umbellata]KAJ2619195.1 hypothetical protein GGI26_006014 [Coemansia sp. RSA 1358]KAJ2670548.1 hypothetical protein GGI25_005793 [Coemansia spiralis]